jgi:hypothetical protein
MTELTGKVGFASPISEKVSSRKGTLGVELIATLALAICLIIAATAVSIGMARAQSLASLGTIHAPLYCRDRIGSGSGDFERSRTEHDLNLHRP